MKKYRKRARKEEKDTAMKEAGKEGRAVTYLLLMAGSSNVKQDSRFTRDELESLSLSLTLTLYRLLMCSSCCASISVLSRPSLSSAPIEVTFTLLLGTLEAF
jgi:hypothetical protein